MARSEEVMELVRKELQKNPDAGTKELFEKAKDVDPSVAELSLRQFHGRYPLQVKRQQSRVATTRAAGRGRSKGASAKAEAATESRRAILRQGLLTFAKDVAGAGAKAELIDVLGRVDEYVDDVMRSLASS